MVTSPTGQGVIVIGGNRGRKFAQMDYKNSKEIFELSGTMMDSLKWKRLKQNLQYAHFCPLVIPIPDELVQEKKLINNDTH